MGTMSCRSAAFMNGGSMKCRGFNPHGLIGENNEAIKKSWWRKLCASMMVLVVTCMFYNKCNCKKSVLTPTGISFLRKKQFSKIFS